MKVVIFFCLVFLLAVCTAAAQWTPYVNGLTDWSVTGLFADGDTLYAGTSTEVFKSTDFGENWFVASGGLPSTTGFSSIVRSGNFLVAGGNSVGIWRSSNYGGTWVQTTNGVASNEYVSSFLAEGGVVYGAFGYPSSVGISTDNGATWVKVSSGLQTTQAITGVAKIGGNLFACHAILGVYVSTNNGANWTLTSPIGAQDKNAIIASGSSLVVAVSGSPSQNGFFNSTDQGATWNRLRTGPRMTGLAKYGTAIYAVGDSLFRSTDDGATWVALNLDGWPGTAVWNTIQFAGSYAYVNFYGVGVYRNLVSGLVAVDGTSDEGLPVECVLEQNYPNPFNPSTSIGFQIPSTGFVSLKVFDVSGREVAVLVNERLAAGYHSRVLNAEGLSSGVYLYRLSSEEQTQTRKLTVIK